MTDDGQAQNSCSNLAGQKGYGGDWGSYLPQFQRYRFCNVKTLSDPPSAWNVFLKTVGSHERISLSRSIKNFLVSIYIHTSLNLPQ